MTHATTIHTSSLGQPLAGAGIIDRLIATNRDPVTAVLRVTLGIVMLPHAAQKAFGWFGGGGLDGTMQFMTGALGMPAALAAIAILAEVAGAVGLITGLLSRAAALGIAAVMVGATVTVHLSNGFFMNWSGTAAGEGFEYHLLAIALAVAVMVRGGGAASLDGLWFRSRNPI